jgi:tRNA G26 N,N-dimethylase Trm1
VLHSLSTSAARYGRYIEPLLSLSIDFYVRLFVRVHSGALETKKALTFVSAPTLCTYAGLMNISVKQQITIFALIASLGMNNLLEGL